MLSLNYENIKYVMTQILKLSCASFSYVNISYVLATVLYHYCGLSQFFWNRRHQSIEIEIGEVDKPNMLVPLHIMLVVWI